MRRTTVPPAVMIDLHTHVLPGIDDGPADLEGSLELLAAAAKDGTVTLAATPHVRPDHPDVVPAELGARTDELAAAAARLGIEIELVAGGEVDLLWAQRASDEELQAVSFGQRGHDLLVETPYGELPERFEDSLFKLGLRGFRILLAHPERSPTLQHDRRRLATLVDHGVLLQVTALSLSSTERRSRSRKLARELVREGLAHVIASDSHGGHIPRTGLREGVEAAARLAPRRARWMVTEAPAAILSGHPLPPAPSERSTGRRLPRLLGG
jgi:protein-tyrosine phosphatase